MRTIAVEGPETIVMRSPQEPKLRLPLLSQYLREQADLTAVERFSQLHDELTGPLQKPYYSDLIPLQRPKAGEQYGFQVDLDRCSGCKACVTACHSLNGLDDHETWRSVGMLHGGTPSQPVQATVTTACHHCVDPGCMKGCPVQAYEKDPITGIVRHLDDQCIGCHYCTLTCPYEVPQFNPKKGIVRKCDMCSDRLAVGEAPACVQACPNEAISIRVLKVSEALENAQTDSFLPGAPSPGITVPTTLYKTEHAMPKNMLPADFYQVRQGHQHMPLVWLLVLNQLSVGAFCVALLLPTLLGAQNWSVLAPYHGIVALLLGLLALGASTSHLGRPLYAYRAFLGLRTSWMSREIIVFGGFTGAAATYAGALLLTANPWLLPTPLAEIVLPLLPPLIQPLGWAVAAFGVLGVFCSVMLYHATHRAWWNGARTSFKFYMTAVVLGLATSLAITYGTFALQGQGLPADSAGFGRTMIIALAVATALKLAGEASIFMHLRDAQYGELKRSALLLRGELLPMTFLRFSCGILGGIVVPLLALSSVSPRDATLAMVISIVCALLLLVGEVVERMNFFSAASAPRMPGGLH